MLRTPLPLSAHSRHRLGTPLMVTIAVWICVMALAGAVVVPLGGWKAVLVIGPVLLALLLAACWLVCVPYEQARAQWDSALRDAARRRGGLGR